MFCVGADTLIKVALEQVDALREPILVASAHRNLLLHTVYRNHRILDALDGFNVHDIASVHPNKIAVT